MSSVGVQRATSHMIPTPGLSVSNNHSYTNMDPSTDSSSFSDQVALDKVSGISRG